MFIIYLIPMHERLLRKWPLALGAAILVLAAIFANYTVSRTPSTSPASIPTVKIGLVTFPGYAPFYLAKNKNLFPGISVELLRIESIGDLRAALESGNIDMYAATYDIFQSTQDRIPPGVGFLAVDESHGADGVVADASIHTIKDLRGKVVGTEPGFPAALLLQYALDKEGMRLDDLQFKDLASQDAGNAFAVGRLDAAGTYEPYLSSSQQKRPGSKILLSSRETPGLIVDILFTSPTLAKSHPEYLKSVADGWFTALKYLTDNPTESLQIMAEAFGVSPQEMADFRTGVSWKTLDDNRKLFDDTNPNNVFDTFTRVGSILRKFKNTNVTMKAEEKLTNAIIRQYDR